MAVAQQPQQAIINQQTLEKTRQTDLQTIRTQVTSLQLAISQLMTPSTWTAQQQISLERSDTRHRDGHERPARRLRAQRDASRARRADDADFEPHDRRRRRPAPDSDRRRHDLQRRTSRTATRSRRSRARSTTRPAPSLFASVVSGKLVLSSQVTGAANTISVNEHRHARRRPRLEPDGHPEGRAVHRRRRRGAVERQQCADERRFRALADAARHHLHAGLRRREHAGPERPGGRDGDPGLRHDLQPDGRHDHREAERAEGAEPADRRRPCSRRPAGRPVTDVAPLEPPPGGRQHLHERTRRG